MTRRHGNADLRSAQRPAGPRRRRPQPSGWLPSRRVPPKGRMARDSGPCQRECRTTFSCGRGEREDSIMRVSPGGGLHSGRHRGRRPRNALPPRSRWIEHSRIPLLVTVRQIPSVPSYRSAEPLAVPSNSSPISLQLLVTARQTPLAYLVRPEKPAIATSCSHRDASVTNCNAKDPVFSVLPSDLACRPFASSRNRKRRRPDSTPSARGCGSRDHGSTARGSGFAGSFRESRRSYGRKWVTAREGGGVSWE